MALHHGTMGWSAVCDCDFFLDILTYLCKIFSLSDVYRTPVACSVADNLLFSVVLIVCLSLFCYVLHFSKLITMIIC